MLNDPISHPEPTWFIFILYTPLTTFGTSIQNILIKS